MGSRLFRRAGRRRCRHRLVADVDGVEGERPLEGAVRVVLAPAKQKLGVGLEVEPLADHAALQHRDGVGGVAGHLVGPRRPDVIGVAKTGTPGRGQPRRPKLLPAIGAAVDEALAADGHRRAPALGQQRAVRTLDRELIVVEDRRVPPLQGHRPGKRRLLGGVAGLVQRIRGGAGARSGEGHGAEQHGGEGGEADDPPHGWNDTGTAAGVISLMGSPEVDADAVWASTSWATRGATWASRGEAMPIMATDATAPAARAATAARAPHLFRRRSMRSNKPKGGSTGGRSRTSVRTWPRDWSSRRHSAQPSRWALTLSSSRAV